MKNLEKLLGTILFYRDKNGLIFTNDGKQLFSYIDKSYNYLVAGKKVIKVNNNMDVGTIVIGAPAHIASFYLLKFIEDYRKKHPKVFFKIINGSTTELLNGLENHKIYFVIDSSPIKINNKDIKIETLRLFETCFIMSIRNKELKLKLYNAIRAK